VKTTRRISRRIVLSLHVFVRMFVALPMLIQSAAANQLIENFPVGDGPCGMASDGANIWVANFDGGNVMKLRASDGVILDTIGLGGSPFWATYDGDNVWVTVRDADRVVKIRASDDTVLGKFRVGSWPEKLVFDGANIWVANSQSASVTELRASVDNPDATIRPFRDYDDAVRWLTAS